MSADLYRVIALTAGNEDPPCEAVFTDANAVLSLTKVAQIFCGQLTPGTGFALYRPTNGDGTLFGIALVEKQPINVLVLEALKIARESITDADIDDLAFIDDVIAKADSGQALQLTKAATDVLAERQRQIDVKGWTPEHDDGHGGGSLSLAATAYIEWPHCVCSHSRDVPVSWPWDPSDFKPKDRRTNLCKATALLLAEIERYDRAAAKGGAT